MISYEPFWETLRGSNNSTYSLINKYHLSSSTIDKLRKNKPLNTTTINDLCRILDCPVESIMVYVPSDKDQVLKKNSPNQAVRAVLVRNYQSVT